MMKKQESVLKKITDLKIKIANLFLERKFVKRSSMKLAIVLFILIYVGVVNAYNLFYTPKEGRGIKLSTDKPPQRYVKYFEKVEVIKPEQEGIAQQSEGTQPPKTSEVKVDSEVLSINTDKESSNEISSPGYEIREVELEQETPSLTQPKKEDRVVEPVVLPISKSDVKKLSYKLELDSLKDGAIIELRISESFSETFTLFVQNRQVYVNEGGTSDKDIQIGVTRSGFEELLSTNDVSSTSQKLVDEGKISVTQYSNEYTLWRKGYKKLGENLGLI